MSGIAATEGENPRTRGLDLMEVEPLVALLAREQRAAVEAVERATPAIAAAVRAIVERLQNGGTLHYFGAGTSGRIATLDASECPPTFGVPEGLVVAHIAGGPEALLRAVEDAAVGISAAGGAAYVVGAIEAARGIGAATIALTSVADSRLARAAQLAIVLETGPEPIAGSTRLKAGTAQKLVLNAISTATMVRLGRVYDNLMVDVVATNAKLQARALRLVCGLAAVSPERAAQLLAAAEGSVKLAVVMERRGVGLPAARELLAGSGGFLRPLL